MAMIRWNDIEEDLSRLGRLWDLYFNAVLASRAQILTCPRFDDQHLFTFDIATSSSHLLASGRLYHLPEIVTVRLAG
jgi:hypothetical protein